MPGKKELAQPGRIELVLAAEEDGVEPPGPERGVQPVLDVAEVVARVQAQRGAQDHAYLAGPGGRGSARLHALGMVAALDRVVPDPLVGVGADALAPAVENERNQGLRDAELVRQLGLGDFLGAGHRLIIL